MPKPVMGAARMQPSLDKCGLTNLDSIGFDQCITGAVQHQFGVARHKDAGIVQVNGIHLSNKSFCFTALAHLKVTQQVGITILLAIQYEALLQEL